MIADIAFCAMLGLVALLSVIATQKARAASRAYLQFAAILYAALAIADEIAAILPNAATMSFAGAVTFVVCALAPAALALALFSSFEHPPKSWIAALLLLLASFAGIGAAVSGAAALAFAPLAASVFAMLALAMRRWRLNGRGVLYAIVAPLCLLASAAAGAQGSETARAALAMFSAAALLGISLTLTRGSNKLVAAQRLRNANIAAIRTKRDGWFALFLNQKLSKHLRDENGR